jgi:hypothetical protein
MPSSTPNLPTPGPEPLRPEPTENRYLELLQRIPLDYYKAETNPENGLVADKTQPGSAASITAVGMALATAPLTVEMKINSREEAALRVLKSLRFFRYSKQGREPDATGYKGFNYHFLDMQTGRRYRDSELSTVDTTFLIAGMLTAATYFDRDNQDEVEIRELTTQLYSRVNWRWATDGSATVTHGWRPASKFIKFRWEGYDEALLLYVLALGSPRYSLGSESYKAWASTYEWKQAYGIEYLFCGPLFTHQLSHIWIDFRGIQDPYMRERGIDYFENSRRATYVHREYAIRNPGQFEGYGENCWGITACNGPGERELVISGRPRKFFDYTARGAPDRFDDGQRSREIDDGTIAPWAAFASLPFAPKIVLPAMRHFEQMDLGPPDLYGYRPSFNQTFVTPGSPPGFWVSPDRFGLDQGPIILMIGNYQKEFT